MRQTDDGLRLVGGRCAGCELVSFPTARACARCGSVDIAEQLLGTTGRIWTWTSQGYPPKSPYIGPNDPASFEPYHLGYVELEDGVRVEARLVGPPEHIAIDQEVELVTTPLTTDADGVEVQMFAFQPVQGASA